MSAPIRTCVGCGATAPRGALVRVRVGDGARVMVDTTWSGGRGAWLHPAGACLERAVRRRAFARAFRRADLACDGDELRARLTSSGGRD